MPAACWAPTVSGSFSKNGKYEKFPQIGRVEIGNDVEIGANACVDRGALGATVIGDGTKLDNLVHIGHNCRLGRHVVIAAQTGLSGGVVVEDYVVMGGQVGISEKARIETRAIVGAQCGILPYKVLEAGQTYWGTPSRPHREHLQRLALVNRLPKLVAEMESPAGAPGIARREVACPPGASSRNLPQPGLAPFQTRSFAFPSYAATNRRRCNTERLRPGELGNRMKLVVIGGHSRSVGKTAVAAGLIAATRERDWTALKLTQYGHGICSSSGEPCGCAVEDPECPYAISRETDPAGSTDTARLLRAGAREAYWVRAPMGRLGLVLPELERLLAGREHVLFESNSILEFWRPDLYVPVLRYDVEDFKESNRRFLDRADALVVVRSAQQCNRAGRRSTASFWNKSLCFGPNRPNLNAAS